MTMHDSRIDLIAAALLGGRACTPIAAGGPAAAAARAG